MKEAMNRADTVVAVRQAGPRLLGRRGVTHCSICTGRIWWKPVHLTEPENVPDPRLSWVLCTPCYQAVLQQVRTSPLHSPLHLRIAMGIVASERWPQAYPTYASTHVNDRKWLLFIVGSFVVAMIIHLTLLILFAALMP